MSEDGVVELKVRFAKSASEILLLHFGARFLSSTMDSSG